jgi:hypothetical protein
MLCDLQGVVHCCVLDLFVRSYKRPVTPYLSENHLEVLIRIYLRALSDPHRARSAWRAYPAFLTYPTHRIVDPTSVAFREETKTRPPFSLTLFSG